MAKKRYIPKVNKKKQLSYLEQVEENIRTNFKVDYFKDLAEKVTNEREARDLFQKAWGAKYNPKIFGMVAEIIEKKGIFKKM